MTRPTNEELEQRRTHPPATRDELRRRLESQVVKWEWATGVQYDVEPFSRQMGEKPWGKLLKAPPKKPVEHYQYGFDASGELLIERLHDAQVGARERFVVRDPRFIRSYGYNGAKQETPQAFVELALDDQGRIAHGVSDVGGVVFRYDRYVYENDKVARVLRWDDYSDGDTFRFEWNGDRLEQVVHLYAKTGRESVEWTAKPPSLSHALRSVAELLPRVVTSVVGAAKIDPRVFCVLLSYSKSSAPEMSLPKIVVGLDHERVRVVAGGGTAEDVFNPASLELYDADALEIGDAALLAATAELAAAISSEDDYEKVRKLYVKTAKALNEVDWSTLLTPTDDFVVLAVDDDVADLWKNAKGSLSPSLRKPHRL